MAFKGLRFAGLEWKNITASKVMWVVIAAIAIMPLLYGALYLAAFQDPYARLNTVPVAVVNEDKGAVVAAEHRNLGNDVVGELKDNDDGLQWNFVSADQAQKGLEDGTYYMTCTIPADFSKSVASADSDAPEKARLNVEYNQSENMLASQIGETVWKEVRTKMSDTVADQYWTTVLTRVADSGKDIRTAADGAGTLKDGLVTARDGSQTITTNLGTLKDGSISLNDGLGTLRSGTFTLQNGTRSLAAGASQLAAGTSQVAGGANAVSTGAAKLHNDGTSVLAAGASQLAQQTSALPDQGKVQEAEAGSQQVSGGIEGLKGAAGRLSAGAEQVAAGMGSAGDATDQTLYGGLNLVAAGIGSPSDSSPGTLNGGLNAVAAGLGGMSDNYLVDGKQTLFGFINGAAAAPDDATRTAMLHGAQQVSQQLSSGTVQLQGAAGQLSAGTAQLQGAAGRLSAGVGQLSAGIGTPADTASTSLYGGLNMLGAGYQNLSSQLLPLVQQAPALRGAILQIDDGASQVNATMSSLVSGASQVAAGATQVNGGASSAVDGANQLNDGASHLAEGATSAKDGAAQIASGAAQLQEGSATLATGLHDAVDGSGELAEKLGEGADTAARQTTNIDGKADVMSAPVELDNQYYTTVKNYGTGFAPYFMALGLWVGGLVAGFVFKPLNKRLIVSGASPLTAAFANYLPVAFFSLVQATLLMAVLQFGLQLQIDNVAAFYAMGYLTALVFAAIMQFLMAALGFPGKFVAIILLMLQLTACAGTFPIQTTPDFFQIVNPYMPMTYVVSGMRQIMTGLDYHVVIFDCFVLFAIGAVCFALTCIVALRKRTVRMDDLHPMLQLG